MGKNKKNRNKNKPVPESPSIKPQSIAPASALPPVVRLILCSVVAIVAALIYSGSYGHDFAYDDLAVVKENRFVMKGSDGIGDILNTQYFEGYDPNTNARAYRPVSLVTYALEYEYFGQNPRVHHFVNILLYALTSIVLLLALLQMLNRYHWSLAFMTTLLFVVHPVHVDVVANIKSRDELIGFLNFSVALLFLKPLIAT